MGKTVQLYDNQGGVNTQDAAHEIFPKTHISAVYTDDGTQSFVDMGDKLNGLPSPSLANKGKAIKVNDTGDGWVLGSAGDTEYTFTGALNTANTAYDLKLTDGTDTDTATISPMVGATAAAEGKAGLVPKPEAGDNEKVLTGAGTWSYILGGTTTTGTAATGGMTFDITGLTGDDGTSKFMIVAGV